MHKTDHMYCALYSDVESMYGTLSKLSEEVLRFMKENK
jgi:hypothetical protein